MRIYHEASFQSKPHSFLYTIPLRQNNGDSNDNNNFSTATFLRSILGYSLIQSKAFPGIFFAKNEEDGAKVAQPTVVVAKARETLIKGSALFKVMFAHNNAWKKKGHTYSIREIGRCWQMHH